MAGEVTTARENTVRPINSVQSVTKGRRSRTGNLSFLLGERENIQQSSGIRLSDNARELRYGSREWDRETNEGAWRSYRTSDNRSFFIRYDGSMFYERRRR